MEYKQIFLIMSLILLNVIFCRFCKVYVNLTSPLGTVTSNLLIVKQCNRFCICAACPLYMNAAKLIWII